MHKEQLRGDKTETAKNETTGAGASTSLPVDEPSPLVLLRFLRHLYVRFAWMSPSS